MPWQTASPSHVWCSQYFKYLRWKANDTGVSLWLNPSFLPKVVSPQTVNQVIEISAFRPEFAMNVDNPMGESLCPVRALRAYMAHTESLRGSHLQLFICYGGSRQGHPVSKQRMSHWLVDTISQAYDQLGLPVPGSVVAHSTRSMASPTMGCPQRGFSCRDLCSCFMEHTMHICSFL